MNHYSGQERDMKLLDERFAQFIRNPQDIPLADNVNVRAECTPKAPMFTRRRRKAAPAPKRSPTRNSSTATSASTLMMPKGHQIRLKGVNIRSRGKRPR